AGEEIPSGATGATRADLSQNVEDAWFLTPDERGNPATEIDRRRGDGRAWTAGNEVTALIHGSEYFAHLLRHLRRMCSGDIVFFTDWRGDGDERLAKEPGTDLATVLTDVSRKGVDVRGLVWRSHADSAEFSEHQHVELAREVNDAGGEILLDERVRRSGCHHQKLVLIRRSGSEGADVAFVGGMDLCHGRRDDGAHHGDPQP